MSKLAMFLTASALLWVSACTASDEAMDKVDSAKARNDGPAIWVARDADSTLYLYGTVHLIPEGLDWQRDDLWDAFADASTVFVEVPSDDRALAAADRLTQSLGYQTPGQRLSRDWDAYAVKTLEVAALSGDLSVAALDTFQPWLAAEVVTFAAAAGAGLSPDLAPDAAIRSRAERQGKIVQSFESIEDQIRLSADVPYPDQEENLRQLLERYNRIGDELRAISDEWVEGDVDALEARLAESVTGEARTAIFTDRNAKWADTLSEWMDGDGTAIAAVGVGHLVGEDSLVDALRSRGVEVERHFAFQGENRIRTIDLDANTPPRADDARGN